MDTNDQYFDCLCRTCMNELLEAFSFDGDKEPQGWLSISDRIEEEHCSLPIAELLTQAVPQIEVQPSDQLPKKICCNCLQQLLTVHRFQQMCQQSEQQMRQQVSKKHTDLRITTTVMEGEIETKNAGSYLLDQPSIQKPHFQTTEQIVKPEAVEMDDKSHLQQLDQSLEDYTDSQATFSELIKNEPIEDDEPSVEYSEDDTIQAMTVKDEMLAIESEEQEINETNVKTHPIVHGEDKSYECPYCTRRFSTISNMNRHKAIHEGLQKEACDICGKVVSKRCLEAHKLTHSVEKAHKCDLCEKSFCKIYDLSRHLRTHTGEKPYKCKYCERTFAQNTFRMKHMRRHLGDNVHRCELCPLAFPAASELRIHFTTHENEDPETRERNMKALEEAEAKLQKKLFNNETQQSLKEESHPQLEIKAKENLKTRRIGADKSYECPYCPRRFSARSNMYQHKAIHEGVEREKCGICGKGIRKPDLKRHQLIHDVKAHKCDFCEKRFAQSSHLQAHMRKHTGEKPYKCDYCESAFARHDNRLKHMRLHVGVNVHRCRLCPLAFPSATELRAHFISHKNEDPESRERNMKALKEEEDKLQLKLGKKSREESVNQ